MRAKAQHDLELYYYRNLLPPRRDCGKQLVSKEKKSRRTTFTVCMGSISWKIDMVRRGIDDPTETKGKTKTVFVSSDHHGGHSVELRREEYIHVVFRSE